MGEAGHDGLAVPGRVVLAHEPSFRIARFVVEPATRQVARGDKSETLEPRVMQVLVALYRAERIVTRQELIERCWDGRVVGDDAINRAISRLRHIAEGIGDRSFSIETIARVGYRLNVGDAFNGPCLTEKERAPAAPSRRMLVGGMAAAAVTAAIGIPLAWRGLRPAAVPPKAIELYERAKTIRQAGTPDNNRQEIAYLREAVRIAPDYGEAWGALAFEYRAALLNDPPETVSGFQERLEEALRNADRFAPGNADAAFAQQADFQFFGEWLQSEPGYRELARRYPDHPVGHFLLGSLLMDVGRWRDSIKPLALAKARSPMAPMPRYKLSTALWSAGRTKDAEREIDEASRWSTHTAIWQTKVKLLAMSGRAPAALAFVEDRSSWPPGNSEELAVRWRLFAIAMISREQADIDRSINKLVQDSWADAGPPVPAALQAAVLGATDLALGMLEGSYLGIGEWASKKPHDPRSGASHPLFQPQARSLWGEPRFKRIVAEMGLERYWRDTGILPDYRRT